MNANEAREALLRVYMQKIRVFIRSFTLHDYDKDDDDDDQL